MKISPDNYLHIISEKFSSAADSEKAVKMKAYMRGQFEFLGIGSPFRNAIQKEIYKEYGKPSDVDAIFVVKKLWELPEREYQYFGMDILDRTIHKQPSGTIGFIEEMIVTKSWWDTVDFISASTVGKYFKKHSTLISSVTQHWMDSGNLWLQRSCVLFQLKYKRTTDLDLLYSFIERLKSSDEFFIRKAIGWALREYSKTDPEEVLNFVNHQLLKPLSRREALKVIERKHKYA